VTVLTYKLLASLPGIEHGFGTRNSKLDQTAMASVKQIHSDVSFVAHQTGCIGEGDAIITRDPGVAVSIRTADCFPILLVDRDTRAVAAIHAGWRGTAAGVVTSTIARMGNEFGTDPRNVFAAIGPGIGSCCYQVGLEVAQQFGGTEPGKLDLAAENQNQLIAAGVELDRIEQVGGCTFCHPAQFFSWRRDHDSTGRMISFIRILAGAMQAGSTQKQ